MFIYHQSRLYFFQNVGSLDSGKIGRLSRRSDREVVMNLLLRASGTLALRKADSLMVAWATSGRGHAEVASMMRLSRVKTTPLMMPVFCEERSHILKKYNRDW